MKKLYNNVLIMGPWCANVITLFPEVFPGPLGVSLIGKALQKGLWSLNVCDLRQFGLGAHQTVDDAPYGGGAGMVIRPDVVHNALSQYNAHVVYLSPKGQQINTEIVCDLINRPAVTFLCGRYEEIDERVLDHWNVQKLRVGDVVLCGGELPAMIAIEGCVRRLPNVVGDQESIEHETFANNKIEHPHYTRPATWNEISVPDVLLSGNHQKIAQWREQMKKDM